MIRTWLLLTGALATIGFAVIVLVAIPQVMLVEVPVPEALAPYTESEARGREIYIANGCVYCHSQQIRDASFTTDVDRGWGSRASFPADYVYDHPALLGTMRTGPDLINVGQRLPDATWHLIHLYDPRAVVPWSIMPAYPYLFEERAPGAVGEGDVVVPVAGPRAPEGVVVVARREALDLVDYLLSLDRDYPLAAEEGAEAGAGRGIHTMP